MRDVSNDASTRTHTLTIVVECAWADTHRTLTRCDLPPGGGIYDERQTNFGIQSANTRVMLREELTKRELKTSMHSSSEDD